MARTGVALLRMQAVENPTDPRLATLVGELSVAHASPSGPVRAKGRSRWSPPRSPIPPPASC
jgi:hypothetical protein